MRNISVAYRDQCIDRAFERRLVARQWCYLTWAQQTENIRGLVIIGSRARTTDPADEWSDLDLLIITTNMAAYIESANWLHEFGTPLLSFTEPTFDGSYERRALFDGFLDVDYTVPVLGGAVTRW